MAFALRWHIFLLLLSPTVFGQTAEKAAAVVLFDEAEALAARGDFQAACPKYAESHRLDPQLGALLHVADCYERVGQFARAWSGFREAAELAEKRGDARHAVARARAAALEPRVSRLTVIVPVASRIPGLALFVDGVELGNASWELSLPVDGGAHRIRATAPGYEPFETAVQVTAEGDRQELTVPALTRTRTPTTTPGGPNPLVTKGPSQERPSWQVPTVVGAYALGAAAIVLGSVFQYKRLHGIDESEAICPSGENCTRQELHDIRSAEADARRAGVFSVTSFIAAGGLLVGGTAILVFGKPTQRDGQRPTGALNVGIQGVELSYAF
jgi:tetratricopeptide (TPR) repeat protein